MKKSYVFLVTDDDALWPLVGADLSGDFLLKQLDSVEELMATVPPGQAGIVLWDVPAQVNSAAVLSTLHSHSTRFAVVVLDRNADAGIWTLPMEQRQIVARVGLPLSSAVLGEALQKARQEVGARLALPGESVPAALPSSAKTHRALPTHEHRHAARARVLLALAVGFGYLGVVVLGLKLAGELAESSRSLKLLGSQQRYPTIIRASLESIRDSLGNGVSVQDALDQLRDAAGNLDNALREIDAPRRARWFGSNDVDGASIGTAEPIAGRHAHMIEDVWAREKESLSALLAFQGVPYHDKETTGTALSASGKALENDVNTAIRTSTRCMPLLDNELAATVEELQAVNERSASGLRLVMLAGSSSALLLVAVVSVLLQARQRQDASLRAARQQTADILRTVTDGVFLLDPDLIIGSSYSSALESLFMRNDFAGLSFEALLQGRVPERTLATALKFVKVLWAERTKENLVRSINPLGEVEMHIQDAAGKVATRFLQFDFHRVRVDGRITHILVCVSDVTARVHLARVQLDTHARAASTSRTDTSVNDNGAAAAGDLVETAGDIAETAGDIVDMLQRLTLRIAGENAKEAALQCVGFDAIPHEYRRIVKDISVQAVSNGIMHGIEQAGERIALGKPAQGSMRLMFQDLGAAGYKFIAEDDGQGLSIERIKSAALQKGFITPEKAQTLSSRKVVALLFQPGFSTLEKSTKDAGRGVGMTLMANLMRQFGGRVAVATMPGKFTRLTLTLPRLKRADTEAA